MQRKADIPSSLNYPIPALKITRLLVSDNFARQGIGTDLIVLANILALMTAYQVGCKFLIVDAKQEAEKFYLQNNFKPFKINDDNTILMFKTINENVQDDIKQQYLTPFISIFLPFPNAFNFLIKLLYKLIRAFFIKHSFVFCIHSFDFLHIEFGFIYNFHKIIVHYSHLIKKFHIL